MGDAERVARRFILEMWSEQRFDLTEELVHPEYQADGRVVGRDFIRRNTTRVHEAFPDFRFEITHVVTEGNTVAVLVDFVGTHEGTFGGIEPTGRKIRFREACFIRIEHGLVVEGDFVSDGLGARLQLGVLPEDSWTNPHR